MKKRLVKISLFLVIAILVLTSGFCVMEIKEASARSEAPDISSHCGDNDAHDETHTSNHTNSILPCCTDGTPPDLVIALATDVLDDIFLTAIDFETLSAHLKLVSNQNIFIKDRGPTRPDFSILRL